MCVILLQYLPTFGPNGSATATDVTATEGPEV